MSKKLITACLALVALAAFALPAVASAATDPQITHPTGTLLNPTGQTCTGHAGICITATQVGATTKLWNTAKNEVQLECTTATMTGWLSKNANSTIEGEIHSAIFGGTGPLASGEPHPECTGTGFIKINTSVTPEVSTAEPWCIKSLPTYGSDEFRVGGGKCSEGGTKKIKFILAPTGIAPCTYESTEVIKGTYTTHSTGDAILSISAVEGSPPGNGFTKTAGGFLCPTSGQLEMSFTLETDTGINDPLYIS